MDNTCVIASIIQARRIWKVMSSAINRSELYPAPSPWQGTRRARTCSVEHDHNFETLLFTGMNTRQKVPGTDIHISIAFIDSFSTFKTWERALGSGAKSTTSAECSELSSARLLFRIAVTGRIDACCVFISMFPILPHTPVGSHADIIGPTPYPALHFPGRHSTAATAKRGSIEPRRNCPQNIFVETYAQVKIASNIVPLVHRKYWY
ncbi:hypothetical protein BT96DRAFT_180315 [Gymnopus androsaceus JB14]|uniref:Uncharacterized protein n=1 Tax=Gymnopus androsaceus JB14 TaxID=1447944 RepID=A0A6A4HCA2_9AGAR|nr:hypothetical protein BT96DRAFT_180315 [Gymnopus androsaceus JB14]